jgi:adenosine deaminase
MMFLFLVPTLESNPEAWRYLTDKKIPVEICLTSNVLCKTASSYEDHHITRLLEMNHPLMICVRHVHFVFNDISIHFRFFFSKKTDDCGVFKTSLSREMQICAETYGMSESDIVNLTVNANRYSFACNLERQLIAEKIQHFQQKRCS